MGRTGAAPAGTAVDRDDGREPPMWVMMAVLSGLALLIRRRRERASSPAAPGDDRTTVPAVLLAGFAAGLVPSIVVSALPVLARELGVDAGTATRTLTVSMLGAAVATPLAGRLGDRYGHRRVLLWCLALFAAGATLSALGAEARSIGWLLAGRTLSGVSGGVFPLAFGLVRSTVGPERRPAVIGLLSALFGIGGAAGMVVSGPLADGLGTPALFWALLPLVAAAFALARTRPRVTPPAPEGSRTGMWALAVGPLGAVNLVTLLIAVAMFGAVTVVPRFAQAAPGLGYGFGLPAWQAGLVLGPAAAAMLVGGPLAARMRARRGAVAPLRWGALCAIASFAGLAVAHDHLWGLYALMPPLGAGYGLAFAALGNLVVDAVPPGLTGTAGAVNTVVRTAAGAVGAQLAAAILGASGDPATETGYTVVFAAFAVVAAGAFAATWRLGGEGRARAGRGVGGRGAEDSGLAIDARKPTHAS